MEVLWREASQHFLRFGPLESEQSAIFQHLNRADLRQGSAQILLVYFLPAGIDDEDELIAAVCDHQIVNDAAIRVCKKRVTLPPSDKCKHIDRNEALERRCDIVQLRIAGPQRDLTHVRNVKQTRMRARV
jgi:hypothetical protein